jgi:chorismate synthase
VVANNAGEGYVAHLSVHTAGESHGPAEVCVVEGVPAGLPLATADIDRDLARRQRGYGRGGRMRIERDRVRILSGVRLGRTLGTPIALVVENVDHANWRPTMQPEAESGFQPSRVTVPRPGHADLAGVAKYGYDDVRDVLERSSARETVGRVAGGAVAKAFLAAMGVSIRGRVIALGPVCSSRVADARNPSSINWEAVERSVCGCEDEAVEQAMCRAVDEAREDGESLGGVCEVWAWGLVPGVGGYDSWSNRLDGRLMGAVGSIPAIKGVEIGLGMAAAGLRGSAVHDPIVWEECATDGADAAALGRSSNRAGGLEGGVTNGMPVIVRAAMKPIPTLLHPLPSVDLQTLEPVAAHVERSDVEAVAAARVVAEAMVALVLADAYRRKFGGDSMEDARGALAAYVERLEARHLWRRSSP